MVFSTRRWAPPMFSYRGMWHNPFRALKEKEEREAERKRDEEAKTDAMFMGAAAAIGVVGVAALIYIAAKK